VTRSALQVDRFCDLLRADKLLFRKFADTPSNHAAMEMALPECLAGVAAAAGAVLMVQLLAPRLYLGLTAKAAFERWHLAHFYHDSRWRLAARRRSPLTEWNYRHNAIFIHIPKAAGLAIYDAFGMERPYDTHAPVAAYLAADRQFFENAFKFAVVRNPWDRLVSAFYFLKHGSDDGKRTDEDKWWSDRYLSEVKTFRDFLWSLRSPKYRRIVLAWRHFVPQYRFVTSVGSGLALDKVVHFECLGAELHRVASQLGVTLALTARNASDHPDYTSLYTEDDIEFVSRLYAHDLAFFGYQFGGNGLKALQQSAGTSRSSLTLWAGCPADADGAR